jgi:hypothetical protein
MSLQFNGFSKSEVHYTIGNSADESIIWHHLERGLELLREGEEL